MTSPTVSARVKPAPPRRLHLVMRDGTVIEGTALIGEDMPLAVFLNGRRGGWMNVTNARRPKIEEAPGHMIVQVDHVLMASAPDGNVAVAGIAASESRTVDIVLVGGKTVRGTIPAAPKQRLSDYVVSAGKFMGLSDAAIQPDGLVLGHIALHTGALEIVRDLRGPDHVTE